MSEPTTNPPSPTVLRDTHRDLGATLVDFHGWEMPLRYDAIPTEHLRVREAAGLFDLCHMGRLRFRGSGAEEWLDRVLSINVPALRTSRAKYGFLLNEQGHVIDDTILYRLADDDWLLVVNASTREGDIAWINEHAPEGAAPLEDQSFEDGMIAIQGPASADIISQLVDAPTIPIDQQKYYQVNAATLKHDGSPVLLARTGYTGEDGFELFTPLDRTVELWNAALTVEPDSLFPTGLGARDTLRLEAGMPLYGNELHLEIDPLSAGLEFGVSLDRGEDFIGRDALLALRAAGLEKTLCGFRMLGRRIARPEMKILHGEQEVGEITSGAPSPTLECPIAMGYLSSTVPADAPLHVGVRGRRESIERVALPFYSRKR